MKNTKMLRQEAVEMAIHMIEVSIKHAILRNENYVNVELDYLSLPEVSKSLKESGYKVDTTKYFDYGIIGW